MLQFIINGVTYNDPQGWQDIEERVYYAEALHGYMYEVNASLTLYGDAYKALRTALFNDGCSVLPCTIIKGDRLINTNVFMNDATFNLHNCSVDIALVDNTYLSFIDNNKDIKAFINVGRSKNDTDISAFTTVQTNCTFGEFHIGVDTPQVNRHGVRLYDAFKFIVAFVSDGQMDFESDFFTVETDPIYPSENRNPTLFDPKEITNGNGTAFPYISFQELITDTFALYNVEFGVEIQGNGRPLLRIEPQSYFKSNTFGITLNDPLTLTQALNTKQFYQLIKMGSVDVLESHAYYAPFQLFSWNQEEYHLGGICNTQNILDIELKTIITDTNIIQDVLPVAAGGTANDGYDGTVCMVILDGNNDTVNTVNPVSAGYQNYNALLKNDEVLNRFYGAIPQSIFIFLGQGQNDARAEVQTPLPVGNDTIITNPVAIFLGTFAVFGHFPVEVLDMNNNMAQDPSTFNFMGMSQANVQAYNAPISALYDVGFRVKMQGAEFSTNNGAVYIVTYPAASSAFEQVFPFGSNFLNADSIPQLQGIGYTSAGSIFMEDGVQVCEGSATMFLNAGDRVVIVVTSRYSISTANGGNYLPMCYFEVFDNLTISRTFDAANNFLVLSNTQIPIDCDTWDQYLANRNGRITITRNGHAVKGYVNDITRNLETGMAEVSIIGTFTNS